MTSETYYRFHDSYTEDGGNIFLQRFPVIKRTPKGAWISVYGRRRFVPDNTRKKFAAPTIEGAKQSFLMRKKRQLAILAAQHDHVGKMIALADSIDPRNPLPVYDEPYRWVV